MVEQFCKSILQIVTRNSKALVNLVMGLASQTFARSVVEVSLSHCYHYQHSSISYSIGDLDKKAGRTKKGEPARLSRLEVEKKFTCEGGLFFKAI
jgi:hypothetical protein